MQNRKDSLILKQKGNYIQKKEPTIVLNNNSVFFLESDLVSHYYLIFFSIFRRGKPALFLENTAKI